MQLECFPTVSHPPELAPGRPNRDWMDAIGDRSPHRCLPLTIANTSGWELLCPYGVTLEWNGGPTMEDLKVIPDRGVADPQELVRSHFAHGVLTFIVGYLFRTPPGWAVQVSGPPNTPKHGIYALTGLIETDWLPFPFTMNWMFTAPGRVRFEKGEPFAFLQVVENRTLEQTQPVIRSLESEPELNEQCYAWAKSRAEFTERLQAIDPATLKESWQRFYFKGAPPERGGPAPAEHVNKRRLKKPERDL